MIPLILVCGAPRTGTNHLCDVMRGFEALKAHGEVFARDHMFTCSAEDVAALIDETGCQVPLHAGSPSTTQLAYEEPFATIAALWRARRPEHRALSLKLFGYHLPRGVTDELFRLGARPIVVKRRIIDAYASKLKAQRLQQWVKVDTTLVKVRGDVRDLRYYLDRHQRWYDYLAERCPDAPVLRYEDDICGDPSALAERIRECVPEVDLGAWEARRGLSRQDRTQSVADKFANWDEFEAELVEHGLHNRVQGYF